MDNIKETVTVILTCNFRESATSHKPSAYYLALNNINVMTNEYSSLIYSADLDYGPCSIEVIKAPEYLNLPTIESRVSLMTKLEISQLSLLLFNGVDYDILVSTVTKMIINLKLINSSV